MLHKLFIVFCTLFFVAACGGSNSSSPASSSSSISVSSEASSSEESSVSSEASSSEESSTSSETSSSEESSVSSEASSSEESSVSSEASSSEESSASSSNPNLIQLNMADSRWNNGGGAGTVAYDAENELLRLVPDFTQEECPRDWDPTLRCYYDAVKTLDGPLDLQGATITYELEIDQSILANNDQLGGIVLISFAQNRSNYGGQYLCGVNGQDIESNTFTYECTFGVDDANLVFPAGAETGQLGISVKRGDDNPEGPIDSTVEGEIRILSASILLATAEEPGGGEEPSDNIIVANMTSGWAANGTLGAAGWAYTEAGVVASPTATSSEIRNIMTGPADLRDAVVEITYEVDAAFIASGASFQVFAQRRDNFGINHFCGPADVTIAAGEQTTLCTIDPAKDFDVPAAEYQVGIQTIGAAAGTITIKAMTITLP